MITGHGSAVGGGASLGLRRERILDVAGHRHFKSKHCAMIVAAEPQEGPAVKIFLSATVALCLSAALAASFAQAATDLPDLSGFWLRVGDLWFDPILDDNEGKPVVRRELNLPDADNIWAGDFDNPILQPWARETVKKNAKSEIRRQHVYTADNSCWPSGVPQVVNLLDGVEFLQMKDRIIMIYQRDHQVRWIWLDRDHSASPPPSWYGKSVGHYEDDTLVIDTIGLKAHKMSVVDAFGTPHTDKLHVVERYRLFSDPFGKGLDVTVHVEDPGAFTMPWNGSAEYRENRGVNQLQEFVCAENNRNFEDGSTFGTIPEEKTPPF